jgi:hypothetical protein
LKISHGVRRDRPCASTSPALAQSESANRLRSATWASHSSSSSPAAPPIMDAGGQRVRDQQAADNLERLLGQQLAAIRSISVRPYL